MTRRPVGRIVGLHRYPVKSMHGEDVDRIAVTRRGLLGDRAYALIDRASGRVVSAKRPRKWPGILDLHASFLRPVELEGPLPPVRITLPDGAAYSSEDRASLEERLSDVFHAPVALESVPPQRASFEYHWPDMEGLVYQGRVYRDEITHHETPSGTFFDSSALLVLTTVSLMHLEELAPESRFDSQRFRPNILIEPTDGRTGFVEDDWVGHTLYIEDVAIEITKRCIRCVMVSLPQAGLPNDPDVMRAAFDHNEGHLGVKGTASVPGEIRVGDRVYLD